LAPVALRAPYAKSLNPPTPLLPCKLNPNPHTPFGPNVGTRSEQTSMNDPEVIFPAEKEAKIQKSALHAGYTRDEAVQGFVSSFLDMADQSSEKIEPSGRALLVRRKVTKPKRTVAIRRLAVVCLAAISGLWMIAGQHVGGEEPARPVVNPPGFARTGWNAMTKQRFMHPPVIQYRSIEGATSYRCSITWKGAAGALRTLESASPEFDLAKVWDDLPPSGPFQITAEALDREGKVLATVTSSCQRMASFEGPYRPAKSSYDEAGAKTVAWLLKLNDQALADKFAKKRDLNSPGDTKYLVVFYSAYIRLLTTYVCLHPQGEFAGQALAASKKYGQALLDSSTHADWVYANVPRSHTPRIFQVGRGGMAGEAYLSLYDVTHDQVWLDASVRIADALKKNQLPDGRWPFRVDPQTGKVLEDYTSDQAEAILLLDDLIQKYHQNGLQETLDRAVQWMLENPCKTFLWQQQWDDVALYDPYQNLEWYDAMLFSEYLLRHATNQNHYEALAEKLARYIEDQFVEWEPVGNEVAPGVREQYKCYYVIDAHSAFYIRLCMDFYTKTHDEIWLKKARAMADTLSALQNPDGYYPTWMRFKSRDATGAGKDVNYDAVWPNCSSYDGEILMRLAEYLKRTSGK
jgi:hypothetical protein